ncbi:hypothetical protein H1C71_020986, partial [Ictidomys tridecemlineatus]
LTRELSRMLPLRFCPILVLERPLNTAEVEARSGQEATLLPLSPGSRPERVQPGAASVFSVSLGVSRVAHQQALGVSHLRVAASAAGKFQGRSRCVHRVN